jgi:hypothetical protein
MLGTEGVLLGLTDLTMSRFWAMLRASKNFGRNPLVGLLRA